MTGEGCVPGAQHIRDMEPTNERSICALEHATTENSRASGNGSELPEHPQHITSDYITVLTVRGPEKPANKTIRRQSDGSLTKSAAPGICGAFAFTVYVPDADALAAVLRDVGNDPMKVVILGYVDGTQGSEPYRLVSRGFITDEIGAVADFGGWHTKDGQRYIARLKENFTQSSWILFDRDIVPGMPQDLANLTLDQWLASMADLIPGYAEAAKVIVPSTTGRVCVDGAPMHAGGAHIFVQVVEARDVVRFGPALLQRGLLKGQAFMRPKFSRTEPDTIVARVPWAIWDPSTFSRERLVYDGKPTVEGAGLTVSHPRVKVIKGTRLDTSALRNLSPSELESFKNISGVDVRFQTRTTKQLGADGQLHECRIDVPIQVDTVTLRADTPIEVKRNGKTETILFGQYARSGSKEKLRCQTPFRDSTSWNAFLHRHADGTAFLFDNGTRTKYVMRDPVEMFAGIEPTFPGPISEDLEQYLAGDDVGVMFEDETIVAAARVMRDDPSRFARIYETMKRQRWQAGDWKKKVTRALKFLRDPDEEERPTDYSIYFADRVLANDYPGEPDPLLMQTADGSFWAYKSTHWERISDGSIRCNLEREIRRLLALMTSKSEAKNATGVDVPGASALLTGSMNVLAAHVHRDGDPLRLHSIRPAVINCSNGEVWLDGDVPLLTPHRPESMLTHCSGIAYDPDATCPTYDQAIRAILTIGSDPREVEERVRHVEEQMGYIIQPARFLKTWILWFGAGDNGKGRLVELLTQLVGLEAVYAGRLNEDFEDRLPYVASLLNKLLFLDDDFKANTVLPDGFLKKISEQKILTGAFKFKDTFTFVCTVAVLMLANNWPRSKDLSLGMRTRAQVVRFERSFKRPTACKPDDPDRQRPEIWEHIYKTEMSGVLNRLIAGYYRVKTRGAFEDPATCIEACEEWLGEANPMARFIRECKRACTPEDWQPLSQVFSSYCSWADDQKIPEQYRATRNTIGRNLQSLGYRVDRAPSGTDNSAVFGVRLVYFE